MTAYSNFAEKFSISKPAIFVLLKLIKLYSITIGYFRRCNVYIHTHTHIHTHTGILLSHKTNEIMPFAATWMNLVIITLSNSADRERLTCRI